MIMLFLIFSFFFYLFCFIVSVSLFHFLWFFLNCLFQISLYSVFVLSPSYLIPRQFSFTDYFLISFFFLDLFAFFYYLPFFVMFIFLIFLFFSPCLSPSRVALLIFLFLSLFAFLLFLYCYFDYISLLRFYFFLRFIIFMSSTAWINTRKVPRSLFLMNLSGLLNCITRRTSLSYSSSGAFFMSSRASRKQRKKSDWVRSCLFAIAVLLPLLRSFSVLWEVLRKAQACPLTPWHLWSCGSYVEWNRKEENVANQSFGLSDSHLYLSSTSMKNNR